MILPLSLRSQVMYRYIPHRSARRWAVQVAPSRPTGGVHDHVRPPKLDLDLRQPYGDGKT